MGLFEIIRQAFFNIKANALRSALTVLIIAFGIMALVGILTSIDGIIYNMSNNFGYLGANSFSIDRKSIEFRRYGRRDAYKQAPPFTYDQVMDFKSRFSSKAVVSTSLGAQWDAVVKYSNKKSSPNIRIRGIDENYFKVTGFSIEYGRNFSTHELNQGNPVCILGTELVNLLFDNNPERALNKHVFINDRRYQVVGVLKSKGASLNESADRRAFIPLLNSKLHYADASSNYDIDVAADSPSKLDQLIDEAIGTLRIVRGLKSYQADDFEIQKSDGLISFIKDNTVKLRAATIAIGLITLLGAAIGLMNIMLVSVTERTKEIGVCKSLGATRKNILQQFLTEAIIICQVGGLLGILLGIPIGNVVSLQMGGDFIIPWAWISLGLGVCFIVGILAGLYPAMKASALDPVECLRYE